MKKQQVLATLVILMTASIAHCQEGGKISVGKQAPDFEVTGIDGKMIKLSDMTAAGNNVAIMFSRAHW